MSSTMVEIKNNSFISKLRNKSEELSGIVLDSVSDLNGMNISEYIISSKLHYNYFIDKNAKIYKLLPDEKAGNVCKYDRYSLKASSLFPVYCPLTDGKYNPREFSPDETLNSVLIELPCGYLSLQQDRVLRDLVLYIEGKYNSEKGEIKLNADNVYLRKMFPIDECDKEKCGSVFPRLVDFMIFKKKINQEIKSYSTLNMYKMCISTVEKDENA